MKRWKLPSNKTLFEEAPLIDEVDVIIVGGGPSGVAASVTCSENGLNTVLIEKNGFCGGAAVAGMSATICGLYLSSSKARETGSPFQIVYGFAERFIKELEAFDCITPPQLYGNTFVLAHETRGWKMAADKLLKESGVKTYYHASVISVLGEERVIRGVVVSSGAGIGIIRAKRVIDCSGDGIVAAMMGEEFVCGADGVVQSPTLIFKLSHVDSKRFWDYYGKDTICHDSFSSLLSNKEQAHQWQLPRKKIWVFRCTVEDEIYVNATCVNHANVNMNMLAPEDITYSEMAAREQMMDYYQFFKSYVPGCEASRIGEMACQIGVRQTRSILGKYLLTNEDVANKRKFDDGIVKSAWPIELHKGEAPKLEWLENDYYEIPFRCLQPKNTENLLVAGRCLSAEHEALASARVTAQCFEYGRAAAIGTMISLRGQIPTSAVSGISVRAEMEK